MGGVSRKRWKYGRQSGAREEGGPPGGEGRVPVLPKGLSVVAIYEGRIARHGGGVAGQGLAPQGQRVGLCWKLFAGMADLCVGHKGSSHAVVTGKHVGACTGK